MKIDNENLSKLKIDIQTSNDTNFLELAILFDKPEFLEMLPTIRKEYGIKQLVDLKDYDKVLKSFQDGRSARLDVSKYKNSKEILEYAKKNKTMFGGIEEVMDLYQLLETDAILLCFMFKRPPYFLEPIKQAIVCGAVNDDQFSPTSIEIVEHDSLLLTVGSFQLPQVAILISPTSTDREIKNAVSVIRHLYKTDERLSYYKPRTDKVNRIRSYREWYWMHLSGMRYVDIANEWADRNDTDITGLDDNRVLKAVNYYKKLLSI